MAALWVELSIEWPGASHLLMCLSASTTAELKTRLSSYDTTMAPVQNVIGAPGRSLRMDILPEPTGGAKVINCLSPPRLWYLQWGGGVEGTVARLSVRDTCQEGLIFNTLTCWWTAGVLGIGVYQSFLKNELDFLNVKNKRVYWKINIHNVHVCIALRDWM